MPRASKNGKSKSPPTPAGAVPEYVQAARLMQRRKVTKRQLPNFTEAMMLLHAPEAQRLAWKALLEGAAAGDKDFVRMALEIFEILKAKGGGISVTQQILQQNAIAGADAPVIGCDAFIRQLAEARAGRALPAPEVVDVAAEA